jgi:hypothetical protein
MNLHKIALALFLGAASMAASAADNSTSQSPDASGSLSLANHKKEHESLRIVEPKTGKLIAGKITVKAEVSVGDGIRPESLRITLNGKNITRHAQKENCGPYACRWTMELSKADRLLSGQNRLIAAGRGRDNSIKLATSRFDYSAGLGSGESLPNYLPPSVGLSVNPGGAQPWVTMTTGTPANLQDNLDPTQYSLPYRDTTFPKASDTPCTSPYQIVLLNRRTPAVEDGYYCDDSAAAVKTRLAGLTKGAEIVLVGTTLNHNADAGLDTTSIGGTNYSSYPASWQPQGYAAIGVSGAAPGSAYESYYLPGDVGKAYQTNPFANGLLAMDLNGNYNFHAGNNIQFEIYPNNPSSGTTNVFVAEGKTIHGWNPPAGSNGFWLLVLDRVTSLPIDATNASGSPCQPFSAAQTCGTFYPTGSSDSAVASQAVSNLSAALYQTTSRQLVVLTTVGQPFQNASTQASGLGVTVSMLGGPALTLQSLATPTSTYTLVAPGVQTHGGGIPAWTSPFTQGVVNSSSVFTQQGQTGFVRGVMARDTNGLYFPSVVSQEDGKMNGEGAQSLSIDYDFYTISTQAPVDWPLTDTPGHIAAYHWASQHFLGYELGITGQYQADVRWYYEEPDQISSIAAKNTDFDCPVNPNVPNCKYPGDGNGFTQQDLADANAQLYTEVTALKTANAYLGDDGINGVISGKYGNAVSDVVIEATYEVLKDQTMAVSSNTPVVGAMFDWMNLLAGLTSIAGAALGPADIPLVAATVGVTSGALWSGSALGPWAPGDPATPPNYESTFDTTLGNMENNASSYELNMQTSYGSALNNIYSDWGKLSAVGAKTADSSSGWQFDNNLTPIAMSTNLQAAVRRSIYLQLLPQFYQLDYYSQQPVSSHSQLGLFSSWEDDPHAGVINQCRATYPSTNEYASRTYFSNSNPDKYDLYVMGGAINNQGQGTVSESLPSDSLLNIVFGNDPGDADTPSGLNIPLDLMYDPFVMVARPGPNNGSFVNAGIYPCYKPGCSDHTEYASQSSCINP